MSLRHGVEAGELHRAAITMTRVPHADRHVASKKSRTAHPPCSFASVEDRVAPEGAHPIITPADHRFTGFYFDTSGEITVDIDTG
jgi:hypothetical protein